MKRVLIVLLPCLLCLLPSVQAAGLPLMTSNAGRRRGAELFAQPANAAVHDRADVHPAMLLMMTSFTRIVIVLSLLRQAMATTQSPPNQVIIIGLSLFLTLFVMGPTLDQVYNKAWTPFSEDKISFNQAVEEGSKPMKEFMLRQTREKDLAFFIEISRSPKPATKADVSIKTLIPAYIISELKNRVPDRFHGIYPVHHHRLCGGEYSDGHGHDDGVTRHHFAAIQADVVCVGGRLDIADGLAGAEFLSTG